MVSVPQTTLYRHSGTLHLAPDFPQLSLILSPSAGAHILASVQTSQIFWYLILSHSCYYLISVNT